jgi:hypothetical protein
MMRVTFEVTLISTLWPTNKSDHPSPVMTSDLVYLTPQYNLQDLMRNGVSYFCSDDHVLVEGHLRGDPQHIGPEG